jgi:predicted DNA binding CopG/RHH family protein
MMPFDPENVVLDAEEQEIEDAIDYSKALSKEEADAILAPYRAEAKKNVTMRLSEGLIAELKKKAEEEGVPYQTLASMVLQKYVRGGYLEREAVREVVRALYS